MIGHPINCFEQGYNLMINFEGILMSILEGVGLKGDELKTVKFDVLRLGKQSVTSSLSL